MKHFYDIYMRPAGTRFSELALDSNALDGWDVILLPMAEGGFTVDKDLAKPLADGTDYVASEKQMFSAGSYLVTEDEYKYFRTLYHNVLVDVMLYDSADPGHVEVGFGLRMTVQKEAELADVIKMRFVAERKYSAEATPCWILFQTGERVVVHGVVTNQATPPVPIQGIGVEYSITSVTVTDTTDEDGRYLIMMPHADGESYRMTFSGTGYESHDETIGPFPTGISVELNTSMEPEA